MTVISRKSALAAAFGAAAARYESGAGIQRLVAERLAERLAALPLPPQPRILELGCGTGFLTRALGERLPHARWLVTDLSPEMVSWCRARLGEDGGSHCFLAMDGERPCLAAGAGFDLICSSLALQWFSAPAAALARLADLLAPGGWLGWSTLAGDSFSEWRRAHAELGLSAAVPDYPAPESLAGLWPAGGQGTVEAEHHQRPYADGYAFLSELKRIGAHLPAEGRRPLPPGALRRILRRFAAPAGIAVTYHIAYGLFQRRP